MLCSLSPCCTLHTSSLSTSRSTKASWLYVLCAPPPRLVGACICILRRRGTGNHCTACSGMQSLSLFYILHTFSSPLICIACTHTSHASLSVHRSCIGENAFVKMLQEASWSCMWHTFGGGTQCSSSLQSAHRLRLLGGVVHVSCNFYIPCKGTPYISTRLYCVKQFFSFASCGSR